jgi:hypothetical protein
MANYENEQHHPPPVGADLSRTPPIYRPRGFPAIQPPVGADLSRTPPIYRAHRRFIGPPWIFLYPD